jgi:hypothetical protein
MVAFDIVISHGVFGIVISYGVFWYFNIPWYYFGVLSPVVCLVPQYMVFLVL